ncbi:MAG: type II toxin-antitoxin system HicA family toxin [Candidatus Magasanikbacteria bacterium]|nr:type II toxin-antitoxin system HicA family toxin [Candidatus Magasanikbacteria bacterium]
MGGVRPISWRTFEKFLIHAGCYLKRERGDHLVYTRPGLSRPIIVKKVKDLPIFIIMNNLRVLGISVEEYLQEIGKE